LLDTENIICKAREEFVGYPEHVTEACTLLKPFAEFFLSLSGVGNCAWDPEIQYNTNPHETMVKLLNAHYGKAADVVRKNRDTTIASVRGYRWHMIMIHVWQFLFSFERRKTCTCKNCRYAHIAFVIKYATFKKSEKS